MPGVLTAVAKRDHLQIPRWLQEHFEPFGRSSEHYKAAPLEEIQLDFSALTYHPDGLKFSTNGVSFRYWEAECRVFDCYRPYIERLDDNDQVVWRRRVPFFEVPVFPFVVEDHLIYIGHHGEPQLRLIILDATNGKIIREWLLPEGLSPINPVSTYPFMSDEYLFIQPCTVDWPDLRSSDSSLVTPQEILAYQLAF